MLWTSSCAACTTAASRGRSFGTWRRQQTLFVASVVIVCGGGGAKKHGRASPVAPSKTSAVKKKNKLSSQSQLGIGDQTAAPGASVARRLLFVRLQIRGQRGSTEGSPPAPCWRNEEPGAFLEGSKASLYLSPSASMTKYLSRPGTSGIVGSGRRHKLHFYVIPMEKGRAGSRMLFQKILLCYIYCLLGTSLHFCPLILLPHDAPP